MASYAELHAWSNFTFLEGGSHPEALIDRVAELGLAAVALTDRDGLYGAVRFAARGKERCVAAIVGSELTFEDGGRIVLLVQDERGYANLCELISTAQLRGSKGDAKLKIADFDGRSDGLIALSGGIHGRIERALARNDADAALTELRSLRSYFGEHFYVELQHHLVEEDSQRCEALIALARRARVAYVATNGVAYARREDAPLADVLVCIKHKTTLVQARTGLLLRPNAEYHLKPARAMRRLFSEHPEAIATSLEIAARCGFRLERLVGQFPLFEVPDGYTRQSHLRELVARGAAERYGSPLRVEVERQLDYELGIIAKMDLAGYFLIVWDIVRAARKLGVLCQGRGSAANSAVCYTLGITAVDPISMNLLFERFMSEERREIPDIDIDFAHEDREKVIQYVYQRYGRANAAMAAEVISYRTRSAIRDVGKAIGLTLAQVDAVAREFDSGESLEGATGQDDPGAPPDTVSAPPVRGEIAERLYDLCCKIDSFPRHMGIHSGGMVITRDPLVRVAPVEWATMRDRTIIQWDKDDLQDLGLIKIDLLGLGMLSLLREAFSLHATSLQRHDEWLICASANEQPCHPERSAEGAKSKDRRYACPSTVGGLASASARDDKGAASARDDKHCHPEQGFPQEAAVEGPALRSASVVGRYAGPSIVGGLASASARDDKLALHTIPQNDPATYGMMQRADTIGVFQIESRAQQSMLPRMKPACFYDIVMEVAIIRPGPIQGQMVHPFLRRRAGLEEVSYPHPKLRPVLERTLGVPLFQEQGMRMAIEGAGFSPGQADQLRRAMGHKRSHQRMQEIYPMLVDGMARNGIEREAAQQLFKMLEGFADYGFPESHAASFALLVYASAYIKCHYPAIFAAAILNVQPMGFYSTEVLVNDAKRHKVAVKPLEVNASTFLSRVDESGALRLGFHLIRGLGEVQRERLEAGLDGEQFRDILEFARRTQLEKDAMENLAAAGAFAPWFATRRDAMWALRALDEREARGELGRLMDVEEPAITFAPLHPKTETLFDLWSTGVTPKQQPIAHFRPMLTAQRVLTAAALNDAPNNLVCRVGGLVITRQRPGTAKGFVFLTLEDETGLVNVIVRPDVYERYRRTIRNSSTLIIEGKLQKESGCIDLLAHAAWAFDGEGVVEGIHAHSFY